MTFLIGGIWHGAGWTFVLWGALHGAALCINRWWSGTMPQMPKIAAWLTTIIFINAAWVIFRADSFQTAVTILRAMTNITSMSAASFNTAFILSQVTATHIGLSFIFIYVLQDIFFRNTQTWASRLKPHLGWSLGTAATFMASIILMMNLNRFSEFIYFGF